MPEERNAAPAPGSGSGPAGINAQQDLRGALHDVANALTVVLGLLDLASRDAAGGASSGLNAAQAWARHGRGIALRAIGATRALDSDGPNDLAALLRDAIAGAEPQAGRRGVSVEVRMSAHGTETLVGWPEALQVLTNIVLNAVAFSPPETTVLLEASSDGSNVHIVVTDQGPGIEPSLRGRIFDGVPSSRPGGSGIGLPHSRALAESQGGSLRMLESEQGARFEVTWPVAGSRTHSCPVSRKRASLSGRRVLVFDDDDAVLCLLQTGLEARGAEVVTATDAAALRVVIASGLFDAALIDLSPLAGDSAGALASMRASSPSVRVVLISGSAGSPPKEAMEAACAWIRKPFEMGEIVAAILGEDAV
ncbi:MAG: hybrid sensor histidine kinase/response regulator [Deltaproteobacteria bacterium]|nr:hybrid sensor histidine kinase/response regulator [Deltaproteobacteria bacterium]